jgi:hypothetical protein
MRKAIIYSLFLHLAILLAVYLDLNFSFFSKIDTAQSMVIDFVNIAEKSAAPKKSLAPLPSEQVKEEAKEKEEVKKEEPKKEEAPKEPEKPKEIEKPKEEIKKEEPKKEQVKPKEEKPKDEIPLKKDKDKPKKEEVKKEESKKIEPKKPKKAEVDLNKPKPKGKKDDSKKDKPKDKKKSLDDVLSGITKDKTTDSIDDILDGDDGENVEDIAPVVTASEIDAVRRKIYPCWSVPAGAKGAKNLIVDIEMELSNDGTVIKADIVDKRRMNSDQYFRIAAESAQRAVLDPKCNPLPFPKGKHDQWKSVTMSFNPKDMF